VATFDADGTVPEASLVGSPKNHVPQRIVPLAGEPGTGGVIPSWGDLCSGRWRGAPRQPARLAGQAAHNVKPSSAGIHPESVWNGGTCCRHLAGRGSPDPAPWDLSARARRPSRLPARRTAAHCKTAVRGPQRRGVQVRLPLGEPIPSRRDQRSLTTGRGTCLVPSRGVLWSDRWRGAPRQPARLAGQAARSMKPSSTGIHPESV